MTYFSANYDSEEHFAQLALTLEAEETQAYLEATGATVAKESIDIHIIMMIIRTIIINHYIYWLLSSLLELKT